MNKYAFAAITNVAALCAAVYLVVHDHPWWALSCVVLMTCISTDDDK